MTYIFLLMHRDALISAHTHSWFSNKVTEGNLKALFLNPVWICGELGTGETCLQRQGPATSPGQLHGLARLGVHHQRRKLIVAEGRVLTLIFPNSALTHVCHLRARKRYRKNNRSLVGEHICDAVPRPR